MPKNGEKNNKQIKTTQKKLQTKTKKKKRQTKLITQHEYVPSINVPSFSIQQVSSTTRKPKLRAAKKPPKPEKVKKPKKSRFRSSTKKIRTQEKKAKLKQLRLQYPYTSIIKKNQEQAYKRNPSSKKVVSQYNAYQRQLVKVQQAIKQASSIVGYTQNIPHLTDLKQPPSNFINQTTRTYNITKLRQRNKEIAKFLETYKVRTGSRLKREGELYFSALAQGFEHRLDTLKHIIVLGSDQFGEEELEQITKSDGIYIYYKDIPDKYQKEVFQKKRDKRITFIEKQRDLKNFVKDVLEHE